ncbi:hypothetical protein [uncultured Dubosiella sp.]|uniref:hypothetical protein n=1 Tax=uncultured Dubosiella sp. TaxID=1937011 RepID=UPI00263015D0|nr:hypothetical protein [uncultured Dubosiella sp.]
MNGGIRQLNSKIAKLENEKKKNDDIIETKQIENELIADQLKSLKSLKSRYDKVMKDIEDSFAENSSEGNKEEQVEQ